VNGAKASSVRFATAVFVSPYDSCCARLVKGSTTIVKAILVGALPLMFAGCTTLKLPPFEPMPLDAYANRQTKEGLTIGLRPLTDPKECMKYFGTDLSAKRVLAVDVSAFNAGPASYVLARDKCSLQGPILAAAGSRVLGSEHAGGTLTGVGGGVFLLSPVAGVALFGVGVKEGSDATVINESYRDKELQVHTLSPSGAVRGCLYFRLPQTGTLPDRCRLHLEVVELKTKAVTTFDFEIQSH